MNIVPGVRAVPFCILLPVLVAAGGATGGCALNRLATEEVSSALERYDESAPDTADAYARTPELETPPPVTATEPASAVAAPATLREFIVRALAANPDIQAAAETARAKAERVRQVTALPDPILSTKTLPEPVRTAEGDNFFILGISQKLPVPGKLDRAGRVAVEETRMALERLQETRLRVIADVKRAYFQLYVIDRSIDVTQANQDLLRGLIDVARAEVASGRRGQDDVLRAQVELSNLEAELIGLRQRRVTAAARLNALLDREPTTSVQTPEDFDIRQVDLTVESLFSMAADANPELKRFARQIDRDEEALKLAELAYWPDFTLGFEWMLVEPRDAFRPPPNPMTGQRPVVSHLSEDGSDNWAILFGFNLPVWFDKIQGRIQEARRTLAASRRQYHATLNRVEFAIEDALERVRSHRELARLFRDTIIPQAEQTYRVSQASYAAGTSDFLYVIDNWRKWLVFTIQYYRSLGELERSVADLEQAIGLSLSEAGAPQ
jgi:cobalt-zinc-cadmium efflux system outer membrane protein